MLTRMDNLEKIDLHMEMKNMLGLSDYVTLDKDKENNKNYLMDLECGKLYMINDTAYALLSHLKNEGNITKYVEETFVQTGEETQNIEREALLYIDNLKKLGYIIES